MKTETIYSDGLVTITDNALVFHNYYFYGINRKVPIRDIEKIVIKEPTSLNGKWRVWGTGNFGTWFPLDIHRPQRDRIFYATLKNQELKIGFTVKDSSIVEDIFRRMNLIKE